MTKVYPLLDPKTIWSFGEGKGVFAASIHTDHNIAAPRIYVKQNDNQVVLYDGCLVDQTGRFNAHDARALWEHWHDLPSSLEGQFVTIQVSKNPPSIEIINDALGVYPVYYLRLGNTYFLSNSVLLLRRISHVSEFDPLGVSLFLCWGWASGDRTLLNDIRVIPGGQHWKWEEGVTEPKRITYFDRAKLSRSRYGKERLSKADLQQLADKLIHPCQSLAQSFAPLDCPITGGRDSRILISLLIRGKIEAQYFTRGASDNIDVQIATEMARYFNLPHRITSQGAEHLVIDDWEEASKQWVQQNDGMVSLAHFAQQPLQVKRLGVELNGAGGEIARGIYNSVTRHGARFFLRGHNLDFVKQYLARQVIKSRDELLNQETIRIVQEYLENFVDEVIDEGFSPFDVPDVFYGYERVRRWAGVSHLFLGRQYRDVFAPLCTRPFMEQAFSISAPYRYTNLLHYQLIYFLEPKLHSFLMEENWPPQQPIINFVHDFLHHQFKKIEKTIGISSKHPATTQEEKWRWLESKIEYIRELCLDQSKSSPLWDLVNRPKFEQITSSDTNPLVRYPTQLTLWDVTTLFQYAQLVA